MPPVPPLAVVAYRTPTTLSLRSFMSNMAPRSRGQPGIAREGDRTGLLGSNTGGDAAQRSRSTIGFEGYFDQDVSGYGEEKKRGSRVFNLRGGDSRRSSLRYSGRYSGRWGESQESFVLGMNDPNSPSRLSPVSDARLSGMTQAASLTSAVDESRTESRNDDGKPPLKG